MYFTVVCIIEFRIWEEFFFKNGGLNMQQGYLSQYFQGVAVKRLKSVEADYSASNQHEFNGTVQMKQLLGSERRTFPARFFWFGYEEEDTEHVAAAVTWYDAREYHPTRSEFRLYFPSNPVMSRASAEDLLILALRPDGEVFLLVVQAGSTVENQLMWLFQTPGEPGERFNVRQFVGENNPQVDFVVRLILEELMIEVEETEDELLDQVLERYLSTGFPTTAEFSQLARETVRGVSAQEDPDQALLGWMDYEERMFRRLEKHLVAKRLEQGFMLGDGVDVEGFIKFSLSVHNTRKSRVGYALENHLAEVFKVHNISYSRGKKTENRSKPDFLFPSVECYHDRSFPLEQLTMLGAKSTCKDRWRQVLSEAARIETKHLLTLEPGISENQTEEMRNHRIQLVLPKRLHETYKPRQREWLISLREFLRLVGERQGQVRV